MALVWSSLIGLVLALVLLYDWADWKAARQLGSAFGEEIERDWTYGHASQESGTSSWEQKKKKTVKHKANLQYPLFTLSNVLNSHFAHFHAD